MADGNLTSFIAANGRPLKVTVKRRKGTRNLRLSLNHANEVVASIPWHCSQKALALFITNHSTWIESQLNALPPLASLQQWFEKSPWLSGSGDLFSVRITTTERTRADYVFTEGGSVIVLRLPDRHDSPEAALRALVRRYAKDAMLCRVAYHAKRIGLSFRNLSVRDQSSRWGSCSSQTDISLNWRLVLLKPELQDYVILHELAHLTEMNHSKRFWQLLDTYDPERRTHEKSLDTLTAEIMRVARA